MPTVEAFLLIVICCLSLHAAPKADAVHDSPIQWSLARYDTIANTLLGKPEDIDTSARSPINWSAVVRVRPPFDGPDSQIALTEAQDGSVALRFCAASESSILGQTISLHESHPSWSASEIAAHIHVRCGETTGVNRQKRLRQLAQRFSQMRTALRLPNIIVTDVTSYHLWSLSGSQYIEMNVVGHETGQSAIIQWIEALRSEVKAIP